MLIKQIKVYDFGIYGLNLVNKKVYDFVISGLNLVFVLMQFN